MRVELRFQDFAELLDNETGRDALYQFFRSKLIYKRFDKLCELIDACDGYEIPAITDIQHRAQMMAMAIVGSENEKQFKEQRILRKRHRVHDPKYMPWCQPFKQSPGTLWPRTEVVRHSLFLPDPQYVLDRDEGVTYLNSGEREFHRVFSYNNCLYRLSSHREGVALCTFDSSELIAHKDNGEALFVISPRGDIFVGSTSPCLFHHSSFVSGEAVFYAGTMVVDNGEVKALSDRSGHYLPWNEHTMRMLSYFRRCGLLDSAPILTMLKAEYVYVDGVKQVAVEKVKLEVKPSIDMRDIYDARASIADSVATTRVAHP